MPSKLSLGFGGFGQQADQHWTDCLLPVFGYGILHKLLLISYLVLHFLFFPCLQFAYFDRDDVALKGFAKFFKESAEEENEHAQMFIKYQNLRGGRVLLTVVNAPTQQEWDTPLAAVEFALNLEKQVNQVVIYIFQVS